MKKLSLKESVKRINEEKNNDQEAWAVIKAVKRGRPDILAQPQMKSLELAAETTKDPQLMNALLGLDILGVSRMMSYNSNLPDEIKQKLSQIGQQQGDDEFQTAMQGDEFWSESLYKKFMKTKLKEMTGDMYPPPPTDDDSEVADMIAKGVPHHEIKNYLIKQGISDVLADEMIMQAQRAMAGGSW